MLNIADEDTGYTPLFYAAMFNSNINKQNTPQKTSNKTNEMGSGNTLENVSLDFDDSDVIKFMLDRGADLNKTAKFDKKALNVAAEYGNVHFLKVCSEWCKKNRNKKFRKMFNAVNFIKTKHIF